MTAYQPQHDYLKDDPNNPFRIDETRVSGQRFAADFSNLVLAMMTSNSGSAAPANHEVGTLWFDTSTGGGSLMVCTRKADATASPATPALWTTVSDSEIAGTERVNTDYRFLFPTSNQVLSNTTQVSNVNGAIISLSASGSYAQMDAHGSDSAYFFVSNDTNGPADLLFASDVGVHAPGAVLGMRRLVGETTDHSQIRMRSGEVWLVRSQRIQTGDVSTLYIASLWRYAPPNLQAPLHPDARVFYAIAITSPATLTTELSGTADIAGTLRDSDGALDDNGELIDANGSISWTTPTTLADNTRLFIISPIRIERLENRGFNNLDELATYTIASDQTFTLPSGGTATFFVYESCPLLNGVSFDYNIVFGES